MFRLTGLLHRRNRIRGHTFGRDPKLLAGISLSSNLNDLFRGEPTYLRPNTILGPLTFSENATGGDISPCRCWPLLCNYLPPFLPSFLPSIKIELHWFSWERVSFIRSWYSRKYSSVCRARKSVCILYRILFYVKQFDISFSMMQRWLYWSSLEQNSIIYILYSGTILLCVLISIIFKFLLY